jgi:hypothetical protein
MSNYAKRAGWTYIGFAKAADLLVVHLRSWRASRPARVERANQRVVLSDKGVVSGIIHAVSVRHELEPLHGCDCGRALPHDTMRLSSSETF